MIRIIGYNDMNFSTSDGDKIDGVKVFFTETLDNREEMPGLIGSFAGSKFIKRNVYNRILSTLKLDNLLNFEGEFIYTRKGAIDGIRYEGK